MVLLTVKIRSEKDVVLARQRSRQVAALLGFDSQEQIRIATAVSEIARNAYQYAGGGRIEFSVSSDFQIQVADTGRGIPDVVSILQGRYKSTTGMGLGIQGARRLVDEFRIDTAPSKGTKVSMQKRFPKHVKKPTKEELTRIVGELTQVAAEDPYQQLDLQSRELLRILDNLRSRQEELAQLNRELEDTNRGVVALYAELDEKAEHLKQADRLKSMFLSNMSHEFRTPLNSIMALSKILLDRLDGPLTAEQDKQVSFIHNAARELTDMVNDLLDLAKVEAGKIEIHTSEVDVAGLLGTLRGLMKPLATNPDVQLIFEELQPDLPTLITDEGKVSQILRNFLSNALKFTDRGEIRVACLYDRSSDLIVFTVSDTGMGIAPEERDQIFEQYYQVDSPRQRKVKGTGLGLPLSKKFAEMLGGSINLKSQVGVGSQFSVRLPRSFGIPSTWPVGAQSIEASANRPPRVLIIDDEALARYLVRKALAVIPAEVQEAQGAVEGMQFAREHKIDVIVLDLVMPDTSGFQLLTDLKSEPTTREIPIVIHTSLTLSEADRQALAQASAIVNKSQTEPQLREVVKSLVARAR